MARIGDTLFVHNGISPAYASWPVARINAAVSEALVAQSQDRASIIHAEDGPLWYRGLAGKDSAAVGAELDGTLRAMGAKCMVIAHKPHTAGILLLHDERLARIDTGISAAYGGTLGWLEILGDRVVAHTVPRPTGAVMRLRLLAILLTAILSTGPVMAHDGDGQQAARRLCARDDILRLTITAPVEQLARDRRQRHMRVAGTLTNAGEAPETLAIQLAPRGRNRRLTQTCSFPPILIRLTEKPGRSSLFHGQKSLKLVTHCRMPPQFHQHVLLEYVAYRLMNQLSPDSFRVRLALIHYVDGKGQQVARRLQIVSEPNGASDAGERKGQGQRMLHDDDNRHDDDRQNDDAVHQGLIMIARMADGGWSCVPRPLAAPTGRSRRWLP